MDWSIILCLTFANVIPIQSSGLGDDLRRRYSARDLTSDDDYIIISAPDLSREGLLPEYTVIRPGKKFKPPNKFPFGKKRRPHYTKSNLLRLLQYLADQRRSTPTSVHSQEYQERILPSSEPARPGHTLIQPTKSMLKSSAKYPRTAGQYLVYGSLDHLGIVHGKTPYRVTYSDFRKANLFELLAELIKRNSTSIGSLRRSRPVRLKNKSTPKGKTKTPLKYEQKKKRKFKKLDSKRAKKEDSESSSDIQSDEEYKKPRKRNGRNRNTRYDSIKDSDESEDTGTRAFGKYKKKTKLQFQTKKKKKTPMKLNAHNKIVDKLKDKLDEKLKKSNLKKLVPLSVYKSKKSQKNKPRLSRQKNSDNDKASLTESNSREESPKYSSSREYRSRVYKKHKKLEYYKNKWKKKQIFRQGDNDGEDSYKRYEGDEKSKKNDEKNKPKDKENKARLVYGSPDNYGIVWGKTPYRTMYSDFRRTSNLLSKILEAYHSYKREKNLKKALVAIRVWPLDKTKMNRDNLDTVNDQLLLNNENEIMDDMSIEINNVGAEYRKQRKPAVKSAFRNRDDNYEKGNKSKDCDDSDEHSSSNESEYEKNPGNPYTLFKNKYKQNWPWHYALGDHINLNPFGPQFSNQGPNGADFFFNRKWWYFNQDDFIPFR